MPSSFSYEPGEINVPAESSTAMRRLFLRLNTKFTTQGLKLSQVDFTNKNSNKRTKIRNLTSNNE